MDFGFWLRCGSRAAESFLGAKFLRYCIAQFPRAFFCKLGQFHSETSFRGHVYTMLPPTAPVLMKRQCLHQGCLALLLNLDSKLNHRSHPLQHISLSILKVRSGFLLFSSSRFMALSVMTNTFKYYYFWYLLCQKHQPCFDGLNGLLIYLLFMNACRTIQRLRFLY